MSFPFKSLAGALVLLAEIFSIHNIKAQPGNPSAGRRFIQDSLRAYVERGRRLWNIPGLAVAVVKDGQVVVSQGFGTRAAGGQGGPVDGNTLFMMASNSKLFTGTALAQLEQEGKLRLDDPVRRYLPGYRLYDSASSQLVSIRDVLGHKLGLKTFQGDFTFWNSTLSHAEIVEKMRLLKPVYPFRQDYGYCNSGFVTAGQIIAAVSGGQPWESWVQARLLTPLGMTNTFPLPDGIAQRPNVALPYSDAFGPLSRLPFDELHNMGPAAGLVSCTNDLTHWLQFQLDSGKYNKNRILPWATLHRTREANTLISADKSPLFPIHFRTYGLGIFSADYNGRQVYWHTGGADGFVTNVCFVPEENLGLTVLTNQDNQSFFEALRYQILDAYLGVPYVDRSRQLWLSAQAGRADERRRLAALAARAARKAKPVRPLTAYAGTYQNPVYGTITVAPQGRQLLVRFGHHPNLTATLDYLDGDTFRLTYSNAAYGIFAAPFTVEKGQVKSLEVRVNEGIEQDPYLFNKN
ncbi:serine hydrolase [Hymenobacter baengnokdamensis]|uniref:serine hydrolase n=1 Tax=Hymenobacter baengnokdamensis TaxID=2615203 RepID=UPI0012489B04|nr:serine hydrolase [Hymenobacter baengnokdamensis]